ncbi:hypothetical protein ABZ543_08155 [Streptomyces roseifaciens]
MDTNTYALVAPDGTLDFKTGVPSQMWEDADPHYGAHAGFHISLPTWPGGARGIRGYIGDCSALDSQKYPPNTAAEHIVTALGGPAQPWFGNVALCGSRMVGPELDLCGLTVEQQEHIRDLHAAAVNG